MPLPLVLMKKLLLDAALRAANDPRVQEKALELAKRAAPHVQRAAVRAKDKVVEGARRLRPTKTPPEVSGS